MRVAIVSTYPPRPCGIGIFSRDLRSAMLDADASTAVDVVSIVRDPNRRDEPEVVAAIRQDVRSDYAAVARTLTSRGTDVVLVEHEYGIFGGEAGAFVISLVEELAQPLVVTLHTVLSEPSVRQAEALRTLCHRATLVTVFTETARRMVVQARVVAPERALCSRGKAETSGDGGPTSQPNLRPDAQREGGSECQPCILSMQSRTSQHG